MYNDSTFDNLFTGYKSGADYIYPSAEQNLVVTFSDFYLSAMEGDFTTEPVTITSETGESEDITVGNAPAKVLTATMLNPDGKMGDLTWGDGSVYIGAETASASADVYQSYPVHILVGTTHYSIDANGVPRRGTTSLGTLGGTPVAVISNNGGTDILFISSTAIGRRQGNTYTLVTTPSPEQAFMAAKFRAMPHSVGVLLDANGLPSVYNSVAEGTKQTFSYVPMGVFDFSGVDAYGITFGVEAYDKMTVFDADATEWWNAIDFDNGGSGRMLSWIAGELYTHYGFIGSPTISASAVNDSLVWNTNPITSYAVTGRDILKWLAEAMGCNARMGRTGGLEFWTFATEPVTTVATIYPDIIISNTRVKGKATVPKMTETICYNVLGAGYQVGSSGSPYYVVANPFIDPSGDLTSLTNINGLVTGIPAYYPNTISIACGDPRWDAGDFVTVNTTDGTSPYAVPIMHEALAWNGNCVTTLSATGKQVRDIPESMLNTDLSSMVDSNPSAVVNKIQAVGISADWITTGKLTVLDSNDDVLFDADKDNDSVEIAGFTVTDQSLDYVLTEPSDVPGKDKETTVHFGTDGVVEQYDDWNLSNNNTPFSVSEQLRINSARIQADFDNSNDPDNPYETSSYITSDGISFARKAGGNTTNRIDLNIWRLRLQNDQGDDVIVEPSGLEITDSTNTATVTASTHTVTDGTNTTTQSATDVTFDDGTASSKMAVIKRTRDAAGTTNITLQRGVYLAIVTHTNNTTAGQQGLYVIQAYDTNSVVLTIAAAANSTLSISGLTLTWTTTNTYRALRLIYLS